jgi:hypothetical protein
MEMEQLLDENFSLRREILRFATELSAEVGGDPSLYMISRDDLQACGASQQNRLLKEQLETLKDIATRMARKRKASVRNQMVQYLLAIQLLLELPQWDQKLPVYKRLLV